MCSNVAAMYVASDDLFFHYTTREAAFEHILPEQRLRLSPYFKMRDPMESKAPNLPGTYAVPADGAIEESMQRSYMEAINKVATLRGQAKLLSLTLDATGYTGFAEHFGRGWARARMWEHYAENHAGVCLLFRRQAFHHLVLAQLEGRSPGAQADAVRYTQAGLAGSAARTLMLDPALTGTELAQRHVQRHLGVFFFTKLVDWESEHEYRFVEPSDDDDYSYVDIGDTLDAVIVGSRFPSWQLPGALACCMQAEADALRLSWDTNYPIPRVLEHRD
jgi:hypothetical protein